MSVLEDGELIVFAYLRQYNVVSLPLELWKLIYKFYHVIFTMVRFSKFYKSKLSLELTENDKCCTRVRNISGPRWIVANDPVYYGIHCWRVFVHNPLKQSIIYAICEAYRRYNETTNKEENVIGIGYNDNWYKFTRLGVVSSNQASSGHKEITGKYQCQHFNDDKKMCVDILLDSDEGTVEFCVVGEGKEKLFRPRLHGLEKNPDYGYVPYFKFLRNARVHGQNDNVVLRLAKIDPSIFGREDSLNWNAAFNK